MENLLILPADVDPTEAANSLRNMLEDPDRAAIGVIVGDGDTPTEALNITKIVIEDIPEYAAVQLVGAAALAAAWQDQYPVLKTLFLPVDDSPMHLVNCERKEVVRRLTRDEARSAPTIDGSFNDASI